MSDLGPHEGPRPRRGLGRPRPSPDPAADDRGEGDVARPTGSRPQRGLGGPADGSPTAGVPPRPTLLTTLVWALPEHSIVVTTESDADVLRSAATSGDPGPASTTHQGRSSPEHQLLVRPSAEPVLATGVGLALAQLRRQRRPLVVAVVPTPEPVVSGLLVLAARSQLSLLVVASTPGQAHLPVQAVLPADVELEVLPLGNEQATTETIHRFVDPTRGTPTKLIAWGVAGPARTGHRDEGQPPVDRGRRTGPIVSTRHAGHLEVASLGDERGPADRGRVVLSWSRSDRGRRSEVLADDVALGTDLVDATHLPALLGGIALGGANPVLSIDADDLVPISAALDAAPDPEATSATCLVVSPAPRPRGRLVPTINEAAPGIVVSPPTIPDARDALRQLVAADRGLRLLLSPPEGGAEPPVTHPWTGGVRTLRKGPDATVVSHGPATPVSLAGAELAEATLGRSVTVLDLGTIHPLDIDEVIASVARTGRCLIVEDDRSPISATPLVTAAVGRRMATQLRCPVETLSVRGDDREAVAAAIGFVCDAGVRQGSEPVDEPRPGT